ncbi:MAG: hypothetical protein ABSF83_13020 [Nitrososphaerales archaeon]|jgi:hypothetical protein
MRVRDLYGLLGIVTVAWLLIIGETYFFVAVVRPLGPGIHLGDVPSSVAKVILTAGLGVVWVVVMFVMDSLYARVRRADGEGRGQRSPTPTSAS